MPTTDTTTHPVALTLADGQALMAAYVGRNGNDEVARRLQAALVDAYSPFRMHEIVMHEGRPCKVIDFWPEDDGTWLADIGELDATTEGIDTIERPSR